jgi:dienelactone hydrolase
MSLYRVLVFFVGWIAIAQDLPPNSTPLTIPGDLSTQMVAGIDRFLEKQTEIEKGERAKYWKRDFSSGEAYEKSITTNRFTLRRIIGALESRIPFTALELVSTSSSPGKIAESETYEVYFIRWPVLEGVTGEGLWLKQKSKSKATIIALPDADQTPEMIAGIELGIAEQSQYGKKLAEAGCDVIIPELINRSDTFSGTASFNRFTNQPHREWIYRQAFELGHHIIGYEVQRVLALVDWLKRDSQKVGVLGYGEGGLIAFYSAAIDPRIDSTLVSGYFGPREKLWSEPIYRNVFSLLHTMGDAEIASLIAPRLLIIEYSESPQVSGPPAPAEGRSGAAPGQIHTSERYAVEEELNRARGFFPRTFETRFELVFGQEGTPVLPGSKEALESLLKPLSVTLTEKPQPLRIAMGYAADSQARQKEQVSELVNFTQGLLDQCERLRDERLWRPLAKATAEEWPEKISSYKSELWNDVIGKFNVAALPLNARARLVYDEPKWKGYDIVLDLWPDVFAWGVLCIPKDLQAGEKRPVVVCQHGLEGLPRDTIEGPEKTSGYQYYKAFTARLAERGYITFAPHNPYRGQDKFRVLQRKANPLGKSLFSIILAQHEQILSYLQSLPFVDSKRIAFYGLSYGGKTAMRVPALLDRYCLSICSADFNEWIKKNATTRSPYSYMFSGEYEMPEFNLGNTYNYGDMAALIAPRPFMVERGHDDTVAPDTWVAHEFARVQYRYTKLGIGDRAEIEVFNGPHTINGDGTFKFLDKHLKWPEK